MSKKLVPAFSVLLMIISLLIAMPVSAQDGGGDPKDPPPGGPGVWTENVCNGEAAIIFQETSETGDGVTLSAEDPWGCPEALTDEQGLLFLEPWSGDKKTARGFRRENSDRACLALSWVELQDFVKRSGLGNGSAWIVEVSVDDNPVVVQCSEVTDSKKFGLNPYEDQFDLKQMRNTLARLDELLAVVPMTRDEYFLEYSDTRFVQTLTNYLATLK